MKTFSTYFLFFENKARHVRKACQTCLVIGLAINLIALLLINFGVLHRPVSKVVVRSTPAPLPAHYLEAVQIPPK